MGLFNFVKWAQKPKKRLFFWYQSFALMAIEKYFFAEQKEWWERRWREKEKNGSLFIEALG